MEFWRLPKGTSLIASAGLISACLNATPTVTKEDCDNQLALMAALLATSSKAADAGDAVIVSAGNNACLANVEPSGARL